MRSDLLFRCCSLAWQNTALKWYRNGQAAKEIKYWKEHKRHNGRENRDKVFYVIRRRDLYCGLFSLFLTTLVRIEEALKKGYIPIVDLQNDFNIYLSKDKIGKENAWEYFFEQPCGYSLQDTKHSRNVIFSSGAVPEMFPYLDIRFLTGETGELAYWRGIVQKHMILSEEAKKAVQEAYDSLFMPGDKVLGVKCRGTDYAAGKPKNHPIQPTPEHALSKAEEIFRERSCTKVFLATEDEAFYRIFQKKFGDSLITNKTDYQKYQGGSTGREEYEGANGGKSAGMEYLVTTMLLARCDCLCAGCVSATVAALLLTEGYEYTYLFDLGIYE